MPVSGSCGPIAVRAEIPGGAGVVYFDPRGASIPEAALDATGCEARHASVHYRSKRPDTKRFLTPAYRKLTVLCHRL